MTPDALHPMNMLLLEHVWSAEKEDGKQQQIMQICMKVLV